MAFIEPSHSLVRALARAATYPARLWAASRTPTRAEPHKAAEIHYYEWPNDETGSPQTAFGERDGDWD